MPNGGSICCAHCANASSAKHRCEIFGTEVSPFYLCRMFRLADQAVEEARAKWPTLLEMEPGAVYEIDNSYPSQGTARRIAFRMAPTSRS